MEEQIIKCAGCGRPLVSLYDKETDALNEKQIVIKCPFCGDKSFAIETIGKTHMAIYKNYKGYIDYIEDKEKDGMLVEIYEVKISG